MKNLLIVLMLFVGFNGTSQTDDNNEYWAGVHIEEAGKCRNKAMAANAAAAAGGGLIFAGGIIDSRPLIIGGGITSLGFSIMAVAFNIQANNHLKKAGKLMHKEQI